MTRTSIEPRVDRHLMDKVRSKRDRLFRAQEGRPQLELSLIFRSQPPDESGTLQLEPPIQINSPQELHQIEEQENNARTRIYTIRHLRSWATLDISYESFEYLIAAHSVFDHLWKCILTFGIKLQENEYEFPPFRAKRSQIAEEKIDELAYVIRRVERNNSSTAHGVCPWSIRQSAVYHQMRYTTRDDRKPQCSTAVFILIAPSHATEGDIAQDLSGPTTVNAAAQPDFIIHECLVRDSLKGWGDYQAWLEAESRQISNRILTLDILEKGSGGTSRNISFSAEDRQRLKQLDYYITDMLVILESMVDLIHRIERIRKQHCQVCCNTTELCSCNENIEEFEEYTAEARTYLARARWLKERVQSTEQLYLHLSDLLAYEEAAALTQLAHASRIESQEMVKLAAQNARDAAAVKVLTIIGLVYLPTTIVSNFFSTEFVHLKDDGNLQISRQVWILAVIAIPLTVLTIFIWWLCDRYNVIEALLGGDKGDGNLTNGSRNGHAEDEAPWSSSIALSTIASSRSRRSALIDT